MDKTQTKYDEQSTTPIFKTRQSKRRLSQWSVPAGRPHRGIQRCRLSRQVHLLYAPAEGRLVKKTVFWHTPILLPLLLISFPFYLLLAFSFRRIHTFKIPLCRTHYFQRLALTTIGLILLPGFPILALLAINGGAPYWFLTGILTSLSGIASLGLGRNPIWASQITAEMATLRGASPDFVKELPFFVQSS